MILNKTLYGDVQVIDLMIGALILVFGMIIARMVSLYVKKLLKEKINKEQNYILVKLVYYGLVIFVLTSALPVLGIRLNALLVAGGVMGIAIGFAGQSIFSNLISGVFLLIERPIKIGNAVKIDDTVGRVEDIQMISTTVRTFDGLHVRFPNQKVFGEKIINYEANVARRFQYQVGIRYMDDADKAIAIIKKIIDKEPFALKYPEPMVFVEGLGESSVDLIVRMWAPVEIWHSLYRNVLWKIKVSLEKEGIEIPFPQRVLWDARAK